MKNVKYIKNCELTKKVWELKKKGEKYSMGWKIRKNVKSYRAGDSFCRLCMEEIHQIIFFQESETLLNAHTELYKKCRHKVKYKLEHVTEKVPPDDIYNTINVFA